MLPAEEQSSVCFADRIALFSWCSVLLVSSHSKWKTRMYCTFPFDLERARAAADEPKLGWSFMYCQFAVFSVRCANDLFRCHVFFSVSPSLPVPPVSHLSVRLNASACHCRFNFYYEYIMRLLGQSCRVAYIVPSSGAACLHVGARIRQHQSLSSKIWIYPWCPYKQNYRPSSRFLSTGVELSVCS